MNKHDIQAYFDRTAAGWDRHIIRSDSNITAIMDAAGIYQGCHVLDVACGTGVLLPDYLARNVGQVTGVDISPEMIRIARSKVSDKRVTLLCADAETLDHIGCYDCVIVYNAFPHFLCPEHLIAQMAAYLRPHGRLCIAHGMSRQALLLHHAGAAREISLPLPEAAELAGMMDRWFQIDMQVSDQEKYIVAGRKRTDFRMENALSVIETNDRRKINNAPYSCERLRSYQRAAGADAGNGDWRGDIPASGNETRIPDDPPG